MKDERASPSPASTFPRGVGTSQLSLGVLFTDTPTLLSQGGPGDFVSSSPSRALGLVGKLDLSLNPSKEI